ncbi:hypothetical protein D0817_06685 [Flavobacterium cupreum]|uniref:Uncharacterized protein n=2 Tax=Flavobacterium TaxID=237 RepID=A0A4Y7UEN1_9FLAO|nr:MULTISPECIES: hypothetical protein [Flavobacterium]RUT71553.1 hypothetical protein D0817_06685 [Flavobacterium cupreum]TCN59608.1 hypothetical protein EV142_102226 [Flavobacterium circumlabens]TEB44887.1 hypothetical protein D0809_06780 [Flavobacterium circumlabens]
MENLELQKKIINLGKLFVKELKLEPGVDTFSRWMAHFIAEKIVIAEESEGSVKQAAEKECFEVILKLWEHRRSLPSGRRPLESFEPILATLSKLNPDNEEPYFFNPFQNRDLTELKTDISDFNSVEAWLNIVTEIDKTSRIWIEYALTQATNNAKNEKTKEWIESTINLPNDNIEVTIVNSLVEERPFFDFEDDDQDDFSKKYNTERLKKRVSELKKYSELNTFLLAKYEDELKKLSSTK